MRGCRLAPAHLAATLSPTEEGSTGRKQQSTRSPLPAGDRTDLGTQRECPPPTTLRERRLTWAEVLMRIFPVPGPLPLAPSI